VRAGSEPRLNKRSERDPDTKMNRLKKEREREKKIDVPSSILNPALLYLTLYDRVLRTDQRIKPYDDSSFHYFI
jgi:hypothetical protein